MARHLSPGVVGEEGVDLIVGVDVRRHELARSAREREGGDDHGHEEGVDEPVSNLSQCRQKLRNSDLFF